jgi:hypothetical protein
MYVRSEILASLSGCDACVPSVWKEDALSILGLCSPIFRKRHAASILGLEFSRRCGGTSCLRLQIIISPMRNILAPSSILCQTTQRHIPGDSNRPYYVIYVVS